MLFLAALAGEIPLKSRRTRPRFEERLVSNVLSALRREGFGDARAWISGARLFVEAGEGAERVIARVFGVYRVARVRCSSEFTSLKELAGLVESCAREWVRGKRFAVRVHRVGDQGFTSIDAAREAGALLKPYSAGVDLENPEVTVFVEVRGWRAYIYSSGDVVEGPGGLPIGVEGRALVLFSGGIDSPVAAWLVAKRGVEVDLLHIVFSSRSSVEVAVEVGRRLARTWLYGYDPKLFVIDLRDLISSARPRLREDYIQVLLRVVMYIAASCLARGHGYDAIVTGESIGQTSSQTLHNLRIAEEVAEPSVPILRPLAGFDKEDTVSLSRRIGLYDVSSRAAEFSALARGPVTTRADPRVLRSELEKLGVREIGERCRNPEVVDLV